MGLLLLVRHGQASFGAEDYDVLSPVGWEQARLLGAGLAAGGVRPDVVVRGDMRRHRETTEAMLGAAGWEVPVEVDARWDEFDHLAVVAGFPGSAGAAEQLDRRGFQLLFEQATARWSSGAGEPGEYAETWADFVSRIRAGLDAAAARAGSGATVVVVTSGGVIATVCAALTGASDHAEVSGEVWSRFNTVIVNSSITRVVVGSTGARLLTFNEHPHLSEGTRTYR